MRTAPATKRSRECSSVTGRTARSRHSAGDRQGVVVRSDRGLPHQPRRIRATPVELTADEAAAVAVATQLWESPELITATQGALLKLRAAGVDVDPDAPVAIASPAGNVDCAGRKTFSERVVGDRFRTGRAVSPPAVARRAVHRANGRAVGCGDREGPLVFRRTRRDRGATRTFRLSRIGGEVRPIGPAGAFARPDGRRPAQDRGRTVGETPSGVRAQVWSPTDGPPRCGAPDIAGPGKWPAATAK